MRSFGNFISKYVFSTAGILLALLLAFAVNMLLRGVSIRADLTEKKLYTLSDGTKNILDGLESKVTLRFYSTRGENQMPLFFRKYSRRVEDLLEEYVEHGNGKIVLKKFDPVPDSDAEDAAIMDGITPQRLPTGEKFYLGLAMNCPPENTSIPFLSPADETTLEYDLSSSIIEVMNLEKPVVGIVSGLPVTGGNPMPMMRQSRPKPPWIYVQELQRKYSVKMLGSELDNIDPSISLLILHHPKNLSETAVYAIDQFLMKGGKLIIAVDPYCMAESKSNPMQFMGQQKPMPGSSSLPRLFAAWGVEFTENEILADYGNAMRNLVDMGEEIYPTILHMREIDNEDEIGLAGLNLINMVYAGTFKCDPPSGLSKEVLLESTTTSGMMPTQFAELPAAAMKDDFKPDSKKKALALRLTGNFKSAFAGKPELDDEEENDSEEGEAGNAEDKGKPEPADETHIKSSLKETSVVLIGDADMLFDYFCVSRQNTIFGSMVKAFNDNLVFIQNLVDQLSGDQNLIAIRGRKSSARPFKTIISMQEKAQDKYKQELDELSEKKQSAERKINRLQQARGENESMILSPEQQKEIEKFQREVVTSNKQLKELRKKLRKDIDSLKTTIEIINIGLVPLLVALLGILYSIIRKTRSRTTA